MLSNVLSKSLWDARHSMGWWIVGVAAYAIVIVGVYPAFQDALVGMARSYPPEVAKLLGLEDIASFATAAGFLHAEIFSFVMPILFVIYAAAYGSGAIAGEEESGTMETLLSEPVAREEVVIHKFGAMAINVFGLGLALWLVLVAGVALIGMGVSSINLAAVCFSISLLGLTFGGIAFAAGAFTGRRSVSIGIAAAIATVTYLVNALAGILEGLSPFKWVSPFFYYGSDNPIMNGLNLGHALALVAISLATCAIAYYAFPRRDLRV